jgi:hypothetical protein
MGHRQEEIKVRSRGWWFHKRRERDSLGFFDPTGNNGTGRNRAVLFSDSLEQLRGTAGARQVTVRVDTALAGCNTPDSCGFIMLSKHPR